VGRGTSTQDGLAIARAIIEHIHNTIGARTMFATHYHELGLLQSELMRMICYTLKVGNAQHKLVLLHEIILGCADKSFGLHVARMAGLPAVVVARAHALLSANNAGEPIAQDPKELDQAVLAGLQYLNMLREINVETLTPKDALDLLYDWKGRVQDVSIH
jgi:DNA mismatch repair protein MutS